MNGNGVSLELDGATAHLLERLAQAWGVSKEEAVRRAVAQAQANSSTVNRQGRLEAFKELQRRLGLTPARAAEWQNAVREARR
jgi:hypothetical protein